MKPLYIFDLDGTLALIHHRRHFVEGIVKDWPKFFAACVDDKPNVPIIKILRTLIEHGADVWVWSGRSDEVRVQTVGWLYCWGYYGEVKMRKSGDHQPDEQLKQTWYDELSTIDRARLVAVFDDRDRVVQMWRRNSVTCLQVAPGNF